VKARNVESRGEKRIGGERKRGSGESCQWSDGEEMSQSDWIGSDWIQIESDRVFGGRTRWSWWSVL